jgi:hypothetical protein
LMNIVNFVYDNHLDKSTSGKGLEDGAPSVACGELRTNEKVDDYVLGFLPIRIEGHQAFNKQTLVFVLVLITMISFQVVLCRCRTLHLVGGQTKQRLLVEDDPPPEEAGELSNEGLAVGRTPGDDEDRIIAADIVVRCNVMERVRGGDAEYFFWCGTKHRD